MPYNVEALAMWRYSVFLLPGADADNDTKAHCWFCCPALFVSRNWSRV